MRIAEPTTIQHSLIQEYLNFILLERRQSANTAAAVQRDLACIDASFDKVSAHDLRRLLAKRHAAGASPASLARMASSWRGFFAFLVERKHLEVNPALALKTPKQSKRLPKAVGVDPLLAMLNAELPDGFKLAQAQALVVLLYCTGLRISEALSLNVRDVQSQREIRVLGKGNKTRVVPLVDGAVEVIRQFLQKRAGHLATIESKSLKGGDQPGSESTEQALWLTAKGRPLSARQAQKDVAQYAVMKGLDQHLHPHMLRHSFGSHVLQGTQNLRAVQELLGHSSIASTQVYTALDFQHLSSVYDSAFPRAK
jgi:integrase/recombinase XerC